jgi:KDO2-lipid IV(A) lauroyltransferase
MSEKKRPWMVDYAIYLAVRVLVCVVQAMPIDVACSFARFLGWIAYKVDKRHRLVAIENLQHAFPGQYSDSEVDRIVRRVYEHFCTMLIEIVFLPRKLHLHNYKRMIQLNDAGRMSDAILSGRPVMFVTGHFGNWELASYTMGMFGVKGYAIARPLDNPYLDTYLRKFREKTGQTMLDKQGALEHMVRIVAEGGVIGTLADQDAGQRGMFVDFFGRPASTHKAIALLALEHNVPLIVGAMIRQGATYCMHVADVILLEDYASAPDAVRAITQRFTSALERLVRVAPEQYFWVHRRWKHQPKPRAARKAAA